MKRVPDPTEEDIATLTNLCRCGTYPRIRKAIKRAAAEMQGAVATWEPVYNTPAAAAAEVAS